MALSTAGIIMTKEHKRRKLDPNLAGMKPRVIIILFASLLYTIVSFAQPDSGTPERRSRAGLVGDDRGKSLIGSRPPEFEDITWLSESPLHLSGLRGKVVLIRWWTAPDCPFCAASAPSLNNLAGEFVGKGFVVIGLYHHKSSTTLTKEFVEEQMRQLDFQFPVGIDRDWENLRRWWLQRGDRDWTSVSFLLDRGGVIRYIHSGGAYSAEPMEIFPEAQRDYQILRSHIMKLLEQPIQSSEGKLSH